MFFLGIIYYLFFLQRIIVKRRDGAVYIAIASLISFVAVIIETLSLNNLLPYGRVTSFSFLAYILAQAILLSARFSRSFDRVETLSTELEEVNISLEESEKKYRTIFEDSKDIIFIAGIDTKIEDISPACEEVLGYPRGELQQMRILDVMVNPELQSQFEIKISTQGVVRNFEVSLRRKDGRKIDALVSATLRRNEDDKVIGVQGNVRDITDRKQAEFERLRALKFQEIAITDPLTKIYNRRHFYETAEKELERAKRTGAPVSLLILDIDHFKTVNDTYGHLAGDQVLVDLVGLCKEKIRNIDTFARFGGEEFILLMPDTDRNSAYETAMRLRKVVSEKPIAISDEVNLPITISLGVASWQAGETTDINTLLNQADHALYQSKENGRNQVTLWEDNKHD
ncbi:MAG: diguanylate cyclase [Chloroflexi bacterium]|nr:diguanylate cyclase [Chloroflexota bacterium]